MNVDPERKANRALLDVVLKDEAWQATDQELRTLAVDAFRGHLRRRRQWRIIAGVLGLIAVIGLALRGSRPWSMAARSTNAAQADSPSQATPVRVRYLSDEELLSKFPPGSCVLVEVDDRKQLVFLDREVERDYLAVR